MKSLSELLSLVVYKHLKKYGRSMFSGSVVAKFAIDILARESDLVFSPIPGHGRPVTAKQSSNV
jgi:hypothetical protein